MSPRAMMALSLVLAVFALGSPAPARAQGESVPGGPTKAARVDSLLAAGRLQEAVWAARAAGDTARADTILDRLGEILRRAPRSARPLSMDSQGVSYTFQLDHGDSVRSIFKVDGSDIFCPACGSDREVAAYRVDRLLGFDLTPMTVSRSVVVEGDTLRGSAMYFIGGARRPDELDAAKPDLLRFFDAVIGNSDRHRSNWLVLKGGAVAIDHNRAFQYRPRFRPKTCWETEVDSIQAPRALGTPWARYRSLPRDSLAGAIDGVVADSLVRAFVDARDRVVDRVERRIRDRGARLPLRDCRFPDPR